MRREQFVYLVGVRPDGCYKIGCSWRPDLRLISLRVTSKVRNLAVLHTAEVDGPDVDGFWVESYLHFAFDSYHERGEWFRLTPRAVATFKTVPAIRSRADLPAAVVEMFQRWKTAHGEWGNFAGRRMELRRVERAVRDACHRRRWEMARSILGESEVQDGDRSALAREIDTWEAWYRKEDATAAARLAS